MRQHTSRAFGGVGWACGTQLRSPPPSSRCEFSTSSAPRRRAPHRRSRESDAVAGARTHRGGGGGPVCKPLFVSLPRGGGRQGRQGLGDKQSRPHPPPPPRTLQERVGGAGNLLFALALVGGDELRLRDPRGAPVRRAPPARRRRRPTRPPPCGAWGVWVGRAARRACQSPSVEPPCRLRCFPTDDVARAAAGRARTSGCKPRGGPTAVLVVARWRPTPAPSLPNPARVVGARRRRP